MTVKTLFGKKQGGNTLTGMKTYYKTTVIKSALDQDRETRGTEQSSNYYNEVEKGRNRR